MTAHRAWLKLHQWIGVVAALLLVVIGGSGAAVVFENEIDRALNPALSYVTPTTSPRGIDQLLSVVRAARPDDRVVGIRLPETPQQSTEFLMRSGRSVFVDPYTTRVLGTRNRQQSLARFLHRLHTELVAGPVGQKIVDWADALFLALAVTGLILWWPRRIVAIRRRSSWKRMNFDAHNAVGFAGSIVFLAIATSGVLIGFENTTDPIVKQLNAWNPEPPALASTPTPGARPISVDAALDAARAAIPGAFASNINVPAAPKAIYRVLMKFPEDRTPAGRSRAYVDQFSGKVLFVENTRTAPLGTRIVNLKRSVHTGDVFGGPTRAIYFLAGLAIVLQAFTGVLIWWNARASSPTRKTSSRSSA